MTNDLIVMHRHIRSLGYCNRGAREFFKKHRLDWADFLENGIHASALMATNDWMAARAVEIAEAEKMNG